MSRVLKHEGSVGSYTIGFLSSIVLTLLAYFLVQVHVQSGHLTLSHAMLLTLLAALALSQFLVQLLFFLHLGSETKPRWKLMVFLFMIFAVLILVGGSLWIMYNLNYNMRPPSDVNLYLNSQDGL